MPMKIDPDDEFFIPEIDFSKVEFRSNPFARKPGEQTEIGIDGAVAYQLLLIPSNRILERFASTLQAWPAIIAAVDGGRSPRTLSLDAVFAEGNFGSISAGPRLERWARVNVGGPSPYGDGSAEARRRVAEGAA